MSTKKSNLSTETLNTLKHQARELHILKNKLNHQGILIESLWSLLREKNNWSNQELADAIKAVESKYQSEEYEAEKCSRCERTLQEGNKVCIYCGADVQSEKSIFRP